MAVEKIISNCQDKIIDDESKIAFTHFWQEVKTELQKL
jgi:preprotein translocase subunit SecE